MNEKQALSKKLIHEALRKYGALFSKAPTDQALELYADMLSENFEFKQVTWALSQLIKKGSPFFPSCGEIFSMLKVPEERKEDQAPIIANEIISFVKLHHFDLEYKYLDTLSPLAREVIQSIGGTQDIRNSENFEIMKAQLERSVKSVIAAKEYSSKVLQLNKIGIKFDGPMKKLSYEFSPEEPA
jgi:hypothetical protein